MCMCSLLTRTWACSPVLRSLLDIIFPPHCHLCKTFIPDAGQLHLCPSCSGTIRAVSSPLCTVCGIPFATSDGIDHLCGACAVALPPFTSARAATVFDGSVRDLIHRFKYDKKVHLCRPLALLSEAVTPFVAGTGAELIIPVPLHRRRLRERGFNQAVMLGRRLAKTWGIPLAVGNLRRIRWTEPQVNLTAEDRARNVRGAFALADPEEVKGRKVILVDDVYTTGSTVIECSRTLRRAGVVEVHVVTVARAL
jgi:ComF family protein